MSTINCIAALDLAQARGALNQWVSSRSGASWRCECIERIATCETWRCKIYDPDCPPSCADRFYGRAYRLQFDAQDEVSALHLAIKWLSRPALIARGEALDVSAPWRGRPQDA